LPISSGRPSTVLVNEGPRGFGRGMWVVGALVLVAIGGLMVGSIKSDPQQGFWKGKSEAIVSWLTSGEQSKQDSARQLRRRTRNNVELVYYAVQQYYADNGSYPPDPNSLVRDGHLKKRDILDGYGNPIVYSPADQRIVAPGIDGRRGSDDDYVYFDGRFITQPAMDNEEILAEEY
ncbi:hypothetical protein ACFL34_05850, partial [Candidatus Sumerlaeota bacterium]